MSKAKSKSLVKRGTRRPHVTEVAGFERIKTGVPGLDEIFCGGVLRGGTYFILGPPGAGKTVFANQLCFHQGKSGKRVIYVTLLSESHLRLFGNLKPFTFFDEQFIGDKITYVSAQTTLEKDGLDGLLKLLSDLVHRHQAEAVFLDSVASAHLLAGSSEEFKKFVHYLNSVLGLAGCTTFLLSSASNDPPQPEDAMVDGIINLSFASKGLGTTRQIEVRKFRGGPHLYGRHSIEMTASGIEVFPRIDSIPFLPQEPARTRERVRFGIDELDSMLGGGLIDGSVTTLLGAPGTGKTQIGMQFLCEGAERGDHSLLLSFYESFDRLAETMARTGRPIKPLIKRGTLAFLNPEVGSVLIDKTIQRLLNEVRTHRTKRLFIDGARGVLSHMLDPDRLNEVVTALARELRSLGVTTLITEESASFDAQSSGRLSDDSAITDNIFEFRHAEIDYSRCQTFNIVKTRESRHDASVRLIEFSEKGPFIGNKVSYDLPYLPVVKRKLT